jgi:hypothetical protein
MTASIPGMHVSTKSKAQGEAKVFIQNRQDASHSGRFKVRLNVSFDPTSTPYPTGTVDIEASLSDSTSGAFSATSIELVNSYGKHNPTIFLTGRCKVSNGDECRYWLMIANNKLPAAPTTPDVVGFVIDDRNGKRIAYGTGSVESGDIQVIDQGN